MNIEERRSKILELLDERNYLAADEVSGALGISPATVRRDFTYLEETGKIVKFHGGIKKAVIQIAAVNSFEKRLSANISDKIRIAQRAAELIEDGDTVFIDASSTTYHMIEFIKASDILIVTNAFYLLPRFLEFNYIPYMLGGLTQFHGYTYGTDTLIKIKSMHFSKSFLGTPGINDTRGLVTYSMEDGNIRQAIIQQSDITYSLADKEKFNRDSFYAYASADETTIITTADNREASNYKNIILV